MNTATSPRAFFRQLFGDATGVRVAVAPGRVNLIGEHTDYNEGWALPMAIDRHVEVTFRARADRRLRVYSSVFDEMAEVELEAIEPGSVSGWMAYVAGTAWEMAEAGLELGGMDCVIDGDLPLRAGLSSSAALEMAVGRALCAVSGTVGD